MNTIFRRILFVLSLAWFVLLGPCPAQVGTPVPGLRTWTDQLGHTVKGALISVNDTAAVLRLENGTQTTVPLAILSTADQLFIQQQKTLPGATPGAPATKPMTWPALVTVDPKALNIVTGKQDAAQRQFQYDSGSFEFTSNAALAGSVVKDIAVDFELIRALFEQLPWGWQPKPRSGPHFRVFLTEMQEDFTALGGGPNSSGGSKDDYVYKKLSSLGLVRVGQRYAFDARAKDEGDVLGLTFRLVMGEMRSLTYPWAALGMEEFLNQVAYHKGTLHFTALEKPLKDEVEAQAKRGALTDGDRMIKYLHTAWKDNRNDVVQLRRQNYLDGTLLIYYFGFLDGDGKGAKLHQYFETIARESLALRAAREASNGAAPRRDANARALELVDTLLAGRTDGQLREEMTVKFRAIGVKL